jgi:GNAT superfamily N-acetyltransferase
MEDHELAALEHANFLATWAIASAVPAGTVADRSGIALRLSGAPARFFNQLFVRDDPGAVTADGLASAVELARSRPAPFLLHLREGIDDPVAPVAEQLGLVDVAPDDHLPAMALHPIPDPTMGPPELEIREVTAPADLDTWVRVAAEGFGMPIDLARTAMAPLMVAHPDIFLLAGSVDGRVVTTGQGVMTGRAVGVYTIATLAEARGRGYGAAITRRVAELGAERGADVAVLQASGMGKPVYERLGYRTVLWYAAYADRTPDAEDLAPEAG